MTSIVFCGWWPAGLLCGEDEGDDETVEAEHLGKDEDKDHAHEEPRLLGGATHARVPDDADGEACCQPAQAHTQARTELKETPVQTDAVIQGVSDEDCHHQAVDGNDPSHDHRDDGLHDHLWPHDRHGCDARAALGCPVGSAQGAEDHGGTILKIILHLQL